MRNMYLVAVVAGLALMMVGCGEQEAQQTETSIPNVINAALTQTVEAGCASCTYKMAGVEGCQLAVKIADKPYLVSGANVDAHEAGLCAAPKQAKIAGAIADDKFVAATFELQ